MTDLERRQLLAAVSTTAAATVAGCTGLLGDDSGSANDDNSDESTNENEEPDDGTGDENGDESEPETPEEFATAFVEKLGAERFEAAADLNSPYVAGNLEQFWMGYTAVHGAFDSVLDTTEPDQLPPAQAQQIGAAAPVDVTMAFDDGVDETRLAVDDGAIVYAQYNSEYERPEYVDLDSFTDESVTVEAEGCHLEGIASVPADATDGSDEVPGVVLVHGSGPADMNLSSYGTQQFTDLAEGLASRGIATLRYHKRTAVCRVDTADHTLDRVTVDDALTAIHELREVDGVDRDRIVVVGHSMGGMVVPRIVEQDGTVAGAVALAAPARPMFELPADQYEHFATVGDHDWPEITAAYEEIQSETERVRNDEYDRDEIVLGYPGALWDSLEAYDHVEAAETIDEPLYFLQGDRDFQVTVEDDFELWETELEGRPDTAFERYEGLDHRFMSGDGPSVSGEYMVRNNVERKVVDDLVDWIDGL